MTITVTPLRLILAAVVVGLLAWLLWPAGGPRWPVAKLAQAPSRLVVIGDSLTTGYKLGDPQKSFPLELGRRLGLPVQVEGINGCTLSQGSERLDSLKLGDPALVLLCLGGNDQLQVVPQEISNAALKSILQRLRAQGHSVAYVEVLSPVGGARSKAWRQICQEQQVAVIPDAMKNMFLDPKLMTDDNIHPSEAGCSLLAERSLKSLRHFGLIPEEK